MSQKFQYLGIINTVTVWRKHFILKTNKNFISFVKHDICRQLLNYCIINIRTLKLKIYVGTPFTDY